MTPVFLDSVGLIALWNKRDQWHAAASAFTALRAERVGFVSTSVVPVARGIGLRLNEFSQKLFGRAVTTGY